MSEPDIVADLDEWLPNLVNFPATQDRMKRARDEIVALREDKALTAAVARHARAEALEQAAKIADDAWDPLAAAIARDIRSLKDRPRD